MNGKRMLYTDVTIEVCNVCSGSCTGCMLSIDERRDYSISITVENFHLVVERLVEWGGKNKRNYRPILVWGDVLKLPITIQKEMYDICYQKFSAFGLTMTLADDSYDYSNAMSLLEKYDNVIFDITIDPFRYINNGNYRSNIINATKSSKHYHLQILLSSKVIEKINPRELALVMFSDFDGVSLGLTPVVERMNENERYRFSIEDAKKFVKTFYSSHESGIKHINSDIQRMFSSQLESSSYMDFIKDTFHISSDLSVCPVVYTIFGDIVLDWRNRFKPIGNLRKESIENILNSFKVHSLSCKNHAAIMTRNEGSCARCEYKNDCERNGIGIIFGLYDKFPEKKTDCFGPRVLLG